MCLPLHKWEESVINTVFTGSTVTVPGLGKHYKIRPENLVALGLFSWTGSIIHYRTHMISKVF